MDKTVKILIIVCIILVAGLGLTVGMLIEKNSGITTSQSNSIGNQSVQNTSNSSIGHVNTTVKTSKTVKNINNGQKLFNGQYYTVINKELDYVGESQPVCPFCGSTATIQEGSKTEGNYYYYFFHCDSCSKNFVVYAKNY